MLEYVFPEFTSVVQSIRSSGGDLQTPSGCSLLWGRSVAGSVARCVHLVFFVLVKWHKQQAAGRQISSQRS
jgi:hypothetical protein